MKNTAALLFSTVLILFFSVNISEGALIQFNYEATITDTKPLSSYGSSYPAEYIVDLHVGDKITGNFFVDTGSSPSAVLPSGNEVYDISNRSTIEFGGITLIGLTNNHYYIDKSTSDFVYWIQGAFESPPLSGAPPGVVSYTDTFGFRFYNTTGVDVSLENLPSVLNLDNFDGTVGVNMFRFTLYGFNGQMDKLESHQVPEPSTLLFLGTGLLGLVGYGRKRIKKIVAYTGRAMVV